MRLLSLRYPLVGACCAFLLGGILLAAAPSPQPAARPAAQTTSRPAARPAAQTTSRPAARAAARATSQPLARKAPTSRPTSRWSYDYLNKVPVPPASVNQVKGTVLVYSGGLKSYFEPCGCQSEMLGGLARVMSLVKGYQHRGLRVLSVDAGNLFFEELKIEKTKHTQSRLKAEMIADLFRMMGVRVMGVGPYDLVFGLEKFKSLVQRGGMTALSANLIDASTRKPIFPGHAILQVGNQRIGFFALLDSPEIPASVSAAERAKKTAQMQAFWNSRKLLVTPALAAAQREVAALKKAKVDMIVLLSTMGANRLQQIVSKVKGITLAIEGDEESAFDPPQQVEDTFLLSTPKEGQKLGIFAMYLRANGSAWAEVETPTSRKEALAKMAKQVKSYEKQARQMHKQGPAYAPIAKVYEKQAKELEQQIIAQRKTLHAPPNLQQGRRGYFHLMLPISSKLPDFPTAAKRVERYQKEVKEANLAALQLVKAVPKDKTGNYFAGAERCKTCHMGAYQFWQKTQHAHAYATLVKRKKQFDLDCISCHVVGWQKPGGLYDIKNPHKQNPKGRNLANVQCENCHSMAGLHADRGGAKMFIRKQVTASVCTQCHRDSHDPNFKFNDKIKKILGKGHGEARLAEILKQEKNKR